MDIEEIREKADKFFDARKYTEALPYYEQAAELGDVYSIAKAATLRSLNAIFNIKVFNDFPCAEENADAAMQWYNKIEDIQSLAVDTIFDKHAFSCCLGYCYYRIGTKKGDDNEKGDSFGNSFYLLCNVVDDDKTALDIQGLWALSLQGLQDLAWDVSNDAIARKNEIYEAATGKSKEAFLACEYGASLLPKIFVDYGFVLLEGRELSADHTKAYHCFKNAFEMGIQSAGGLLGKFAETAPGKYTFVG